MSILHHFHRNVMVIFLSLSINLILMVSFTYAGGGAVNHVNITVQSLMSEAPTLEGNSDSDGVKAVAVILFFRRDKMWDGSLAMSHKKLYSELFRSVLLPRDIDSKVVYSEIMMEKWANEFNSTTALAELLKVLSFEEDQKRALCDVATKFIQGCEVELREHRRNGRNTGMEEKLIKEFSSGDVFWQAYWVGVAQGLWTSASVEVDRILTEDQKRRFYTQLRKWQEVNKTLLGKTIPVYIGTSSDSLESELAKFDSRRAGTETLKEELASECLKLLGTYSAPEEQGKIYAEVAHIYGQSGRREPSKIIKYVKKALEYPLEPGTKAGLYIYWGDAIQIESSIKGEDFANARKKAVKPYLEGLKFVLSYDLPDEKPELPSVNIFTYDDPKSDPVYQEMLKEYERQWKVRKEAEFLNDMIQHRDTLIGQMVFLYTRYPFATTELEELLKQTLGDKHKIQIEKIIQKVKEDINIRQYGHIPMQLEEAVSLLKEAHLEMKSRNDSGEYYLALAIDAGDAELRQPTRFWVFDYSPVTGHKWVISPRSLPGVYTRLTSMTVNGHFPMEYLTENGELISMREGSDVIAHPYEPILISYGSTTAELELKDDSRRSVKIVLSPQ